MGKLKEKVLTGKQSRFLYEICRFVRTYERNPTMTELGNILNVSKNATCTLFSKLQEYGYVKGAPYSRSWEIIKWFDEDDGRMVDIIGELYNDIPVIYRARIGQTWLPLKASVTGREGTELFAVRVKSRTPNSIAVTSSPGDVLLFQRSKKLHLGNTILASYNSRLGLFKFALSQNQEILQQGMNEQSNIILRSMDELNVIGTLLLPFKDSSMQLL